MLDSGTTGHAEQHLPANARPRPHLLDQGLNRLVLRARESIGHDHDGAVQVELRGVRTAPALDEPEKSQSDRQSDDEGSHQVHQ